MIVARFGNNHKNYSHSYFTVNANDELSAARIILGKIKTQSPAMANKFKIVKEETGYVIRTIDPSLGWEYGIIFIPYQNKLTSNEKIAQIVSLMTMSNRDETA